MKSLSILAAVTILLVVDEVNTETSVDTKNITEDKSITSVSILKNKDYAEEDDEEEDFDPHAHPYGKPINLMKFVENETIIVDFDSIDKMFNHPDVKHRKIVAVSIIGAFRKGKSFLMDYGLRYMYANYKSVAYPNNTLSNKNNWIGDPNEPLKGFSWRGGTLRDTTGVVLWSDVFLHEQYNEKTNTVEEVAIILMDTQGLFDSRTSPTDNSRIFALGTLISSVQIFNLNDVIQENQLEYLHMATDFAKLAIKAGSKTSRMIQKPFQSIIFLMRDWRNDAEYEYGRDGGAQYLFNVLNIDSSQPEVLQEVRRYIADSFDQRLCFLLPYPGDIVSSKDYDGRFSGLSSDFQTHLKDFLSWLLGSKNLKKKRVLNNEVNGDEYAEYMKSYFEVFQSDDIPRVETLHELTVRKHYDIIIIEVHDEYKKSIKKVDFKIDGEWRNLTDVEEEMNINHRFGVENAMKVFHEKKKLGGPKAEKRFELKLKRQLEDIFNAWKEREIDTYKNRKYDDEQRKKELEEIKKQNEEMLRKEWEKSEAEMRKVEQEYNNKIRNMEENIANSKNLTAEEIKAMTGELLRAKQEGEKQKEELLKKFNEDKENMLREQKNSMEQYQKEVDRMKEQIRIKEEETRRQIESSKSEQIEMMRIEAEQRKMRFDHDMKLAEKREKAMIDQRNFEREQMKILKEQENIRMEKLIKSQQDAEKARYEADAQFKQKLLDAQHAMMEGNKYQMEIFKSTMENTVARMQSKASYHSGLNHIIMFLSLIGTYYYQY